MDNNIYDKIFTKFKITIEIFIFLTLMGIIFLNLLILGKLFIIREDTLILLWLVVYSLIVFLEYKYSIYNVKLKINSSHIFRYFYYLFCIVVIVLSAKLLSDFYANFKFDDINNFIDVLKFQEYILITFFLLVLIDIMSNEKVVIFMAIASIIYGIIDDKILNVLLALIGIIVGTISSDDIKIFLESGTFDDKKFIKDKLYFTIAIISSAFVINDYVDKLVNEILDVKTFESVNKFRDTLYKGSIRLIFSIFLYASILFVFLLVKDKLVARYTKGKVGSLSIKNHKTNNPKPINQDEPKVVTYGKKFVKADANTGERLEGAEFGVKNGEGKFLALKDLVTTEGEGQALEISKENYTKAIETWNKAVAENKKLNKEKQLDDTKLSATITVKSVNGTKVELIEETLTGKTAEEARIAQLKEAYLKAYAKAANKYEWVDDKDAANVVKLISDVNGKFEIKGLEKGTYKIVEVKAPEGYALPSNIEFEFTVEAGSYEAGNVVYDGTEAVTDNAQGSDAMRVNNKLVSIPKQVVLVL